MENNIILSICIPTYNRVTFLRSCLSAIMLQITEDLPVEILVSDNCSTDNTQEIIKKYSEHPKFRSFIQIENIGPTKNGLKLIKEYARGKFCWFIGDDDYIINGGIKSVISILQMYNQIDFIFVKVDGFKSNEDIIKKTITKDFNFEIIQKFENLIQPKYSNIFLCELMAGIFRRELWLKYDKIYTEIEHEYLSTLATTYAHCVIYANQFMGKKAIYISTPIVIADDRAREWLDKAGYIIIEHLFALLKLYKKNGLKGKSLRICKFHYLKITFPTFLNFLFNKKAAYRDRISFKRYFLFLISNPIITIKLIMYYVAKKILKFN